jgi:hypothetical protein
MPLDVGNHALGSGSALVAEAGVGHDRLLGRPPEGSDQELTYPPLQHLVGRRADRPTA